MSEIQILPYSKNSSYELANLNPGQNRNSAIQTQASTDEQIIDLWLFGKSKESQRAYLRDIKEVLSFIPKPLNQIILRDLQQYSIFLEQKKLAPRSRQRKLAAIKSLMSFATKLGELSIVPTSRYSIFSIKA